MPLTSDDQAKYKDLYLQTAREYIFALKENSALLLNEKETPEVVEILHRSAHSLNSQSKMMEYLQMASAASLLEQIFQAKIDQQSTLSPELKQTIAETAEQMEKSLDALSETGKENDLSALVSKLQSLSNLPSN